MTYARNGDERSFLDSLRGGEGAGSVVVLGYEFGLALMGEPAASDDAAPAFALLPSTVLMLDHASLRAIVAAALAEDSPWGDLTSEAFVPASALWRMFSPSA